MNRWEQIVEAIRPLCTSLFHADPKGGPATVVDGLFAIAGAIERLADSVEKTIP